MGALLQEVKRVAELGAFDLPCHYIGKFKLAPECTCNRP
jgi:hypothetical protein